MSRGRGDGSANANEQPSKLKNQARMHCLLSLWVAREPTFDLLAVDSEQLRRLRLIAARAGHGRIDERALDESQTIIAVRQVQHGVGELPYHAMPTTGAPLFHHACQSLRGNEPVVGEDSDALDQGAQLP